MRRDLIVLIVIIIIAIVVIVWLSPNTREGFKNLGSKYMATKTLKKDVDGKVPLCGCGNPQGSCKGCAMKNKKNINDGRVDSVGEGTKALDASLMLAEKNKHLNKQLAANNAQLYASSLFDLFTPQEDTVGLYGVTKEEMDLLVDEYRKEHEYVLPTAPKSLTFNIKDTDRANDILEESMYNLAVHRRPYEQDAGFSYLQNVN